MQNNSTETQYTIEDDDVILVKEKYSVSATSVRLLGANRWINDEVMNGYSYSLINEIYYYIDTYVIDTILSKEMIPERIIAIINDCRRIVIFYLNINKVHWSFIMLNISTKTLYQYDPMNNENRQDINYLLRKLFPKRYASWTRENIDFIRQRDSFNCGVYCLYFLYTLIKERRFQTFDPIKFRAHIEKEIMMYK